MKQGPTETWRQMVLCANSRTRSISCLSVYKYMYYGKHRNGWTQASQAKRKTQCVYPLFWSLAKKFFWISIQRKEGRNEGFFLMDCLFGEGNGVILKLEIPIQDCKSREQGCSFELWYQYLVLPNCNVRNKYWASRTGLLSDQWSWSNYTNKSILNYAYFNG